MQKIQKGFGSEELKYSSYELTAGRQKWIVKATKIYYKLKLILHNEIDTCN